MFGAIAAFGCHDLLENVAAECGLQFYGLIKIEFLCILKFMYTKNRISDYPAQSAEQAAYEYLQEQILTGVLPGGTPIRQESIAEALSLSRMPVRDALRRLASDGLVTIESNRRVCVSLLDSKELFELFEMRAALEGLAVRHAVAHLSASDFDHVTWLAERMDRHESIGDQWLPMHEEFHEFLCAASGLPRLVQEIRRLRKPVQPQIRLLIAQYGSAEVRASNHRDLVKAIRNGSPEQAERSMRDHVAEAAQQIMDAVNASRASRASHSEQADRDGNARRLGVVDRVSNREGREISSDPERALR